MKHHEEPLHLLILEDNLDAIQSFEMLLRKKYKFEIATTCAEARELWNGKSYDVIFLDIQLPDGNGLDVLKEFREAKPDQEILITSGLSDSRYIVEAIKRGATDYITKPVDKDLLFCALNKIEKTKRLMWEKTVLLQKVEETESRYHGLVGDSLAMRHIYQTVTKLKGTSSPILVMGESGVGKEVIARAIHRQENDTLRPFVAVNCAAIPENLLESELFGHEKGAFTGASQQRLGKFVQANGGDIFLDEIASMSPTLQAKLLRVLQDKIVEPLGSGRQIRSNFRVIAATNEDIQALIEKGDFRKDLYFRLKGVEIYIPPLRARIEDVPLLIEYILKELSPKFGRRHFTQAAMQIMMEYDWPGNVRELKNTVENILILTPNEVIDAPHLPLTLQKTKDGKSQNILTYLKTNIQNYERDVLVSALKRYRGNKSRAAKELGISRSILYRKMKALGMEENEIF